MILPPILIRVGGIFPTCPEEKAGRDAMCDKEAL
jgi:hypothetical protein